MLNIVELQVAAFVRELEDGYHAAYGGLRPDNASIIAWVGSTALELIAGSDALYHDVEHTMLVTLVGQEILRGLHIRMGGVKPEDWLNVIVSLVCHDIGYVKGICRHDRGFTCATGRGGGLVTLPQGSTDAALTPYHVDRGKLFVEERFADHQVIDVNRIRRYIEPTRFPVPNDDDTQDDGYAAVVRAADLIGQLSDPRYLQKIPALFYEFEETGVNKRLGYADPGDLRRGYPKFYWTNVYPFIREGLGWLEVTQRGRQMRNNLFANVFLVEHENGGNQPIVAPAPPTTTSP